MPVLGGSGTPSANLRDRGDWTVGVTYIPGDIVNFGMSRHICAASHTAGAVFDTAHFLPMQARDRNLLVDGFHDVDTWAKSAGSADVTITAGDDDPTFGRYMRLSVTTTSYVQRPFLADGRGRFLSFKVRFPDGGTANVGLEAMLTQSAFSGPRYEQSNSSVYAGNDQGTGWVTMSVAWPGCGQNNGAVAADLADIRAVGFYIGSPSTNPLVVDIADLRIHDNPLPPGVLWLFDDARVTQRTVALSAFTAAGMIGNIYCADQLLGTTFGGYPIMSLAQLQDMKAAGWTVAMHGSTHTSLTSLTNAQVATELAAVHDYLVDHDLAHSGRSHLAYPYGNHSTAMLSTVAAFARSARTTRDGGFIAPYGGDRYRLTTHMWGSGSSTATVTAGMDRIAAEGGVYAISFHDIDNETDSITEAELGTLISYAAGLGLPSYSLEDVFPEDATPGPTVY